MPTLSSPISGKVRDAYPLDERTLVMVASDRVSAFDVVMAEPIPDKGRVLTAISAWWFARTEHIAPNHLISTDLPAGVEVDGYGSASSLAGRTMLVRRAEMLPLECIVRGYLAGSAWTEYKATRSVHGQPMPAGLRLGNPLPEAVFTPSTKAAAGHDVNIDLDEAAALVGSDVAGRAADICLAVYREASAAAAERGVLIADTKLELGWIDGELSICDELLTPDSSRFWPDGGWEPGSAPPALDKQPLRDWLEASGWAKVPPPPPLPAAVVEETRARYVACYELLSGESFAAWPGVGTP